MDKSLKKVLEFRNARNWKQFHEPKNLAISLVLETSELLETFQWSKDNTIPKGKEQVFEKELADVYYCLLLLAHDSGVDLNTALIKKMKENEKKYPTELVKGKSKKYSEY